MCVCSACACIALLWGIRRCKSQLWMDSELKSGCGFILWHMSSNAHTVLWGNEDSSPFKEIAPHRIRHVAYWSHAGIKAALGWKQIVLSRIEAGALLFVNILPKEKDSWISAMKNPANRLKKRSLTSAVAYTGVIIQCRLLLGFPSKYGFASDVR